MTDVTSDRDEIGLITMPEPGAVSIHFSRETAPHSPPPLIIRRSEHPEAFDGYVTLAGGLNVGETKKLIPYAALVEMNNDLSITVAWFGGNYQGEVVQEPHIENLNPGDSRYDLIIKRVPTIKPGQTIGFRN